MVDRSFNDGESRGCVSQLAYTVSAGVGQRGM